VYPLHLILLSQAFLAQGMSPVLSRFPEQCLDFPDSPGGRGMRLTDVHGEVVKEVLA
jgi:hypothetical protein